MPFAVKIDSPEITKQVAALNGFDKVFTEEGTRALKKGDRLVIAEWRGIAAVKTGQYRASIRDEVKPVAGTVLQGRSFTDVRSARGFPYPRALEESTRYHYLATRYRGRRTAGMLARKFKELVGGPLKTIWQDLGNMIVKRLKV